MTQARPGSGPAGRARLTAAGAIALCLAIYGAALLVVNLRLRSQLRAQVAGRDAQVLQDLAQVRELAEEVDAAPPGEGEGAVEVTGNEFAALLRTERLKGLLAQTKAVIGARLFDVTGRLITTLPPNLTDAEVPTGHLETLRGGQPASSYRPSVRPEELFLNADPGAAGQAPTRPVLEVWIPLRRAGGGHLIGAAELLLDGQGIAAEFAALDRRLVWQAAGLFLAGGGLLAVALIWAFGRLARANRLLLQRTTDLAKANTELALAARVSAVGAVSAHLIHGLKNPLSGLQSFVASQTATREGAEDDEWAAAANTTQRMQGIIHHVARILQEETQSTRYEVTAPELVELVGAKAARAAQDAGVLFEAAGAAQGSLTNRDANLVMLILENLLANAIQATPAGRSVRLHVGEASQRLRFEVRDQGPGFPEDWRARLFRPGLSRKPGGSGIGLAISKQLANHLGAELELTESGPQGCVFVLGVNRVA